MGIRTFAHSIRHMLPLLLPLTMLLLVFWTRYLGAEDPRNQQLRIGTICEEDERGPDTNLPVARVYYSERAEAICTAWLAPNGFFVTAGHCTTGYYRFDTLQFDVPNSSCDGRINLPKTDETNRTLQSSIVSRVDLKTQQDWAIFRLQPNAGSGLPSLFHNGQFFRISNLRISKENPVRVLNSGYGVDLRAFAGCKSRNRTLQTGTSTAYHSPGYLIHFADTHMGNSGSPIYHKKGNGLFALGTHRGGGCPNIATATLHPDFLRALNDASGRPTVYVDPLGPDRGEPTGEIQAPFQDLQKALAKAPKNGEINIIPGDYSLPDLNIRGPVKIRAPFGKIVVRVRSDHSEGEER